MASAAWPAHEASPGQDDFNHFLDMSAMANMADGLSFDFHAFHDAQPVMGQPRHQQQADSVMAGGADMMPQPHHQQQHAQQQHHHQQHHLRQHHYRQHHHQQHHRPQHHHQQQHAPAALASSPAVAPSLMPTASPAPNAISSIDAQIQYLQQQKFHHYQRQLQDQRASFFSAPSHSVPPTPQSLELPPVGSGQLYSQPEHVARPPVYDSGYHQRVADQQDMAFTPLVSPAVTPLDPHFSMENPFAVPAPYFSPLTSPALHAQTDCSSTYDHSTHSDNSPIEMDLDAPAVAPLAPPPAPPPAPNQQDLSKKARKNNAVKARGKASVKSSPITKPQCRRTGPSPALVSQVLSEVGERSCVRPGDHGLLPMPATLTDGSEENASVSPENLTDMPPPPVPNRRSTSKSPYMRPQDGASQQQPPPRSVGAAKDEDQERQPQHAPHPATPASLMKLPASKARRPPTSSSINQGPSAATEIIESLQLPEAISNRPPASASTSLTSQFARIETALARGPAAQPLPSPGIRASGTASAGQSPQLRPGSSGPSARKSTPQLAPRNSRKRSTSSVHASPALLPKISPNIKPLLPGTPGMSAAEDTASRLLMSKSNYQNILEGNTVPGVSYPSELSTNLTSKRTSHKIAEQGRRNRINSALQIMAGMLPESQRAEAADEADKKEGRQSHTPSSKASVVENAIVHMKKLVKENGDLKQEVEELKNQIEKLQGSSSADETDDMAS